MSLSRTQHVVNDQLLSVLESMPNELTKVETIVFLHGWGSEASVWSESMEALSREGYRSIAPDLPGFGRSEMPLKGFSVDDYCEIIRNLIFQCEVEEYVLVGHSFGGRIAIKTASTQPSYLRKLILTGAAGVKLSEDKRSVVESITRIGKKILPSAVIKKVRKNYYNAIGSKEYLAIPELESTFKKVVGEDLTPFLHKIAIETLLVWGSKDEDTPLAQGNVMKQSIPQSQMSIYEGAGHYAFLDNPPRFNAEMIAFLCQ